MKAPKPRRVAVGSGTLRGPYVAADCVLVGIGSETVQSRDRKTLKLIHDFGTRPGGLCGGVATGAIVTWDPKQPHVGVREVRSGSLLWSRPCLDLFGGANGRGRRIVVRDRTAVSIISDDGRLIYECLDPEGQTGGGLLSDDLVFVATPRETIAVSSDGVELWRRPLAEEIVQRTVAAGGREDRVFYPKAEGEECFAFGACGTCRISLADGSIMWTTDVGPVRRPLYSTPVLASDLVLGAEGARVFGVERANGRVRFDVRHAELEDAYYENSGVVHARRYAFCSQSGHLAVVDIDTGSLVNFLRWKQPLWRMMELDGRLLVATGDGELLVFDEAIWGL